MRGAGKFLLYYLSNKSDNSNYYKDDCLNWTGFFHIPVMKWGIKDSNGYSSEREIEMEESVEIHDSGFGDQAVPW